MNETPEPIHEDHEQDDFDETPEAFDDVDAPDLGTVSESNERLTLTFEGSGHGIKRNVNRMKFNMHLTRIREI